MKNIHRKGLSQNQLKVVAVIAMLIDHVGAEFFPHIIIFRIIGRLAFPLFSYFIYEGVQYTRDKKRYFLRIFSLGFLCAVVYYIYSGEIYGNVLITFSLSIAVLYGMERCTKCIVGDRKGKIAESLVVCVSIVILWFVGKGIHIDYGIIGVLLPAFAELIGTWRGKKNRHLTLAGFSVGLLLLAINMGGIQYFGLVSVPLLLAYNGQRGNLNLKNFFYWFYPVHLAVIGLIAMLEYFSNTL